MDLCMTDEQQRQQYQQRRDYYNLYANNEKEDDHRYDYYYHGRNANRDRPDRRRRYSRDEEDSFFGCVECGTWNDNHHDCYTSDQCHGCGRRDDQRARHHDEPPARRRRRPNHEGRAPCLGGNDKNGVDTLDEFGRERPDKNSSDDDKATWPCVFEGGASSYVFDGRSGMFYEAASDFFYDPKSKLYFGNKTQLYYKHCGADRDQPFQQVGETDSSATSTQLDGGDLQQVPLATRLPIVQSRPTIAIKLTSKVLPGHDKKNTKGKTSSKDPKTGKLLSEQAATVSSRTAKQDASNMEMWSERGRESRSELSAAATSAAPVAAKTVAKTASGQPVCLVCRRKFATLEKLRQHEKLSALHKENLEKKKELDAKKQAEEEVAMYRDRALERRVLHGPETLVSAAGLPTMARDLDTSLSQVEHVVRPEDNLGGTNIGNQMLQKLGWKSGGAIGRNTRDTADSEGASNPKGNVQNALVKDWERIESIAGSQQGSRGRGAGIGH